MGHEDRFPAKSSKSARRRGSSGSKCSKFATTAPTVKPNSLATFDHCSSREASYLSAAPLAVEPAMRHWKPAKTSGIAGDRVPARLNTVLAFCRKWDRQLES